MINPIKSRPYTPESYQKLKAELKEIDKRVYALVKEMKPPHDSVDLNKIQKLCRAKNDQISLMTRMNQAMLLAFRNILERKSCPDKEARKFLEVEV